jgi:dihydrofolate synthase / folylpolyglutamate synthase
MGCSEIEPLIVDGLLQSFQHFGVNLGLERIQQLLERLGNPHQQVPTIHVAGTNGKGSVCAYLSSVLAAAGFRVGRYISPHLVNWCERICLNEAAIAPHSLEALLLQVQTAISPDTPPTQFEVITAAAWLYFAQQQVDIAVIEVGLGGRLDATNVCDRPLVSIITSISREHWQVLGPTVGQIAGEKAGILKVGCPAVIGPLPPEAKDVIARRVVELGCPAVWPLPAKPISSDVTSPIDQPSAQVRWVHGQGLHYPLPLAGDVQLINSALAIAALQILQQQGWTIPNSAIQNGMANARWPGRMQWVTWHGHSLLVDGAHNPAAAQALRQYVSHIHPDGPVHWVMGMLSTKDHRDILAALLQPGDRLSLVPVPDHNSAIPSDLATIAQTTCPKLEDCQIYPDLQTALTVLTATAQQEAPLMVLCGSLYLIGHFFQSNGCPLG